MLYIIIGFWGRGVPVKTDLRLIKFFINFLGEGVEPVEPPLAFSVYIYGFAHDKKIDLLQEGS